MATKITPLLVIVGETASGKTELAIQLAKEFNGEIICADSWTVRREVNIGTAKPSLEDQKAVPHHLLDVVGPNDDFSVSHFKNLAVQAIKDIASRGKVPIMVGGTGLYIDSVIYDYSFLPIGEKGEREKLNQMSLKQLLSTITKEDWDLSQVDVNNKRRLIRLIETKGAKPTKNNLRPHTLILGLQPARDILNERIIKRVDAMIETGLEDEVGRLAKHYGWQCEALKGIGYAQWEGYFKGQNNLQETRQKIIKANMDLAKKQRTWFKRNKSIHWITTPIKWNKIVELTTTVLYS